MEAPDWVLALPAINAGLNGAATLLLTVGYALIRRGRRVGHERCMLAAFATSILFLGCYVTYHVALHQYTGSGSKRYPEDDPTRPLYLTILVTHVVLAAAVPVLTSVTLWRAWKRDWERHRRIAKITFPIWLYVSVTGVIIYWMLYHFAAGR